MSIAFITPTDITARFTYSTTIYSDVDVSDLIPAGATGVILHIRAVTASPYNTFLRKNGSTDTVVYASPNGSSHGWYGIGVDANRIFEARCTSNPPSTNIEIILVGYTNNETVWLTNPTQKTLSGPGAFEDIDISADSGADTAIGVIGIALNSGVNWAVRCNGSTDNRYIGGNYLFIVGVDGSEIFEAEVANVTQKITILGYITKDAIFNVNATDVSLGSTGSYVDFAALPAGPPKAIAGIYEQIAPGGSNQWNIRKNGSSDDWYYRGTVNTHTFAIVECDANRVVEGKIANTAVDFFLIGYFTQSTTPIIGYKSLKGVGI